MTHDPAGGSAATPADGAPPKPTVWTMVKEAVAALGGSTTNTAVRRWVQQKYPGTNHKTISCQLIAGTVNHPSRVYYGVGTSPRPANDPKYDVYFRPAKGKVGFYDPDAHGKWEIFRTAEGKLGVRLTAAWPTPGEVAPAPQPARPAAPHPSSPTPSTAPTAPQAVVASGNSGGEVAWVARLRPQLEAALQSLSFQGTKVRVDTGYRLPYAYEVTQYQEDAPDRQRIARYETDLLVYDDLPEGKLWVPRVVVECKIKGVTTHDALTYSSKAATHKHVHPYLRYGLLIGSYGSAVLPARLVRHGAYFDFMAVWEKADPAGPEWEDLIDVLVHEVRASRELHRLLTGEAQGKKKFRMLHRPLHFKG